MTSPIAVVRQTFAALAVRNFRLYFFGQAVSVSGTWMQRVAQAWLVLELTDSGAMVGVLTAVQNLPLLLFATIGGLVADRFDKRRVLYFTQTIAGSAALALGVLVLTDTVELWMVFGLAFVLGLAASVDNPTRDSFVMEMVGRSKIANAVALHSVLVNSARIVGPAVGGLLIVSVGIGWCFVLNAFTYVAFLTAVALIRGEDIERTEPGRRRSGQLREAFRYVLGSPLLSATLGMSAVMGLFAGEFEVTLPLLARFTFNGDADMLGTMFGALGAGAVVGGLVVASRGRTSSKAMLVSMIAVGVSLGATSIATRPWIAHMTLVGAGISAAAFFSLSGSILQLEAKPEMRGRVVGLRATALLGMRPIGAPIIGWVGEHIGPRYTFVLGSVSAFMVVAWARRRLSGD